MNKFESIELVKGFLDHTEGLRLYELAKEASKAGACLEIGSYCGKSAVYLGSGCKDGDGILYTIDHHRGNEEQQKGEEYFDPEIFDEENERIDTFSFLRKTIDDFKLETSVVPIVSKSEIVSKCWKTPLSLLFIDGSHTFESAFNDFNCWSDFIIEGGYLLIHDIFKNPEEGGQAPHELYKHAIETGAFEVLDMTKTLGVLKKKITS
ncbi:MAG: class I SAM-dependent methyltransferase [Desulfobacterales bacterium]|nr:class I SAM-dependent methyltransferase [Desulfobacterales bacterium]MCP4160169.1 class I SAM-dependent methyltransferase [Deltaproteobacteria bacterium]